MTRWTIRLCVWLISAPLLAAAPEWGVAIFPDGTQFGLEIAADPAQRERGYMSRERIGPEQGMLFIFETVDYHGFWMKNCRVVLDIVWLDDQLRVVHIAPDQPPCREGAPCPTVSPLKPARYVLEVAGGTTRARNLETGDKVIVLTEPPLN